MGESTEDSGLRGYLAERDVPCPGCGYNLRGLPGATCPECTQDLKLTVGLADSRIGALVACLGPLFAGVGASGALLTVVVVVVARVGDAPRGRESIPLVWIPLACLITCGVLAAVLVRRRGRNWLRTRPDATRFYVVLACAGLPAVWFIVFLSTVFGFLR